MASTVSIERPATVPFVDLRRDLLLVLASALALRLIFGALISDTYDYDEFVLLLLSRDVAHGAVPYHAFMFFHPPGALVILRMLEPLTQVWWPAARLFTITLDTVTAGLVWHIGTRLYDRRTALTAGLLYAVSPLALVSAARVGQDPMLTVLGTVGLALLLSTRSQRAALVAGACLGLAIWIKYPAVVFLPVYLLAAPRRALSCLLGAAVALALAFAPFLGQLHALYDQTVAFQRTRWLMDLDERLQTAGLYWLLVNLLALPGLARGGRPLWLRAGFVLGGVFLLASQVYYHYFVPVVPFAALLAAPLVDRAVHAAPRLVLTLGLLLIGLWAFVIDDGGPSPLFVTAAHLSDIQPTIDLLDRTTRPGDPVLADRYEYAYLANRPALAHYFWNVGVLVHAPYLERRVPRAGAVVLSYGASSGFPAGFVRYLNAQYTSVQTPANTVWLTSRQTASG
jgi:4-amino-4-deoxy-L-arabinose transferase-like glycosyltransferase